MTMPSMKDIVDMSFDAAKNVNVLTKRIAFVRNTGNSIGLVLREELLDMGADADSQVVIYLTSKDGKKQIVIEKV